MKWLRDRKIIKEDKYFIKQVDQDQWRLQMFKRRKCVVNKYSMKEGK